MVKCQTDDCQELVGEHEPWCDDCWVQNTQCCGTCKGRGDLAVLRDSQGRVDFLYGRQRNGERKICKRCGGLGRVE